MAAKQLTNSLHTHRSPDAIESDRLAELPEVNASPLEALLPLELIGRHAETQQAIALWQRLRPRAAPKLLAIAGQAGVGKSAFALHLVQQLKFGADARIYLNLRSDPSIAPAAIEQQVLRALSAESLSELGDRRILLLLDHLENAAQLQPLLSLGTNCTILITSRQAPKETAAIELQPLTSADAIALLQAIASAQPIQAEAKTAKAIVQLCDKLPLAMRLVAGLLQQPVQLLDCLQLLSEERKRCEQSHQSYPAIRASFNLSCRHLDTRSARLLRLLGLLPEPSFPPNIAAALCETAIEAEASIARLLQLRLLETEGKRYCLPDSLRRLAKSQLAIEETTETRQAARLRLAQAYQETAELISARQSDRLLTRRREGSPVAEESQTWLAADRPNLLAAIDWAIQAQAWEIALPTIACLSPDWAGDRAPWQSTLQTAIAAAQQRGDRLRTAQLYNQLGNSYAQQGDWEKAKAHYQQSLESLRDLQEPIKESQTIANLGIVYLEQGDLDAAAAQWAAALERLPAGSAADRTMSQWMHSTHDVLFQTAIPLVDRPATGNFLGAIGGIFKRLIS